METHKEMCDAEVEESCIILKSLTEKQVLFQYQSLECEKCDLMNAGVLEPHAEEKVLLKFVPFGTTWKVIDTNNDTICSQEEHYFQDGASYSLLINSTDCLLKETHSGGYIYLPLAIALAVYVFLGAMFVVYKYLERKKLWSTITRSHGSFDEMAASYSSNSYIEDVPKPVKQRLRSLDTVRGISVAVMIFVNYGGGKYWFFHHARWNGLTVGDLVFPWFIWMMGMSLAMSLRSLLRKSMSRRKILWKILMRSIRLFSLGLMLNTLCLDVDLNNLRISGVLQRFSLCYLVVASVHVFFAQAENNMQDSSFASVRDIIDYWGEWVIMIVIMVAHLLLTFLLPVPNCPLGYLGPGGLHDGGNYSSCTGGAAGYIDRTVLGNNHLYQHPTFKAIYKSSLPYDPEGILGYLTSTFLVFLGLQAGKILLTYDNSHHRIYRWLLWSAFTGVLAMLLCGVSKNDGWIPVNKNLWSVSFIFATGSLAFLLMAICYYIVDVRKWWTGAPFFYCGMNSILLYVGHSMTHNVFPWSWKVPNTHESQLALDLWGTTLWVIIAVWAHKIEFFITV